MHTFLVALCTQHATRLQGKSVDAHALYIETVPSGTDVDNCSMVWSTAVALWLL